MRMEKLNLTSRPKSSFFALSKQTGLAYLGTFFNADLFLKARGTGPSFNHYI